MATSEFLHWLLDSYVKTISWEKSATYSSYNITKYGNSWFDGSSFYNQSTGDFLHAENILPVTSAVHLGLVTGLFLAVLLNCRLNTSKGIDWQYWLETMGMSIMFTVLCLMLTLAILPFLVAFLAIFACYRKAIEFYLKNMKPQFVTLLEGLDAIWAVEDDASLSVINTLALVEVQDVLSGNELLDSFRRTIVSNFATPPFPCPKLFYFRQKCLGYFYWEKQHQLRIEDHVRWMQEVEADNTNGITEDTLKGLIAEMSNSKLPQNHAACWEILVGRQHLVKQKSFQTSDVFQAMEEGFPEVSSSSILRYPVLFRIHHSLGDGIALMKMLLSGLADKNLMTEDLRSRTPSPIPAILRSCDFTSANSNLNGGSVISGTNSTPLTAAVTPVRPKDLKLPEKTMPLHRLPKSEIVIELENLSDEQDRADRNRSPIFVPPTIPEDGSSFSNKEQVLQNTALNARPGTPFLTPTQSPLPPDQHTRTSSPFFINNRCLSPEASFQYHSGCGKETKRSGSPLLLTTRCHSPIIGKTVLKSPGYKYHTNASQTFSNSNNPMVKHSNKCVEDFFNAPRSASSFSLSRPTSPHAMPPRTLVRSHSVSTPPASVHREDSPHMRNATSVQCYQQNNCHCFSSNPQSNEQIPYQGGNTTTIYYYNTSGSNSSINMMGRRDSFERYNKISTTNPKDTNTHLKSKCCSSRTQTFYPPENYNAKNLNSTCSSAMNNVKDNGNLQCKMSYNNLQSENRKANEKAQFPVEDKCAIEKAVSRTSNVGTNTEIINCISSSTQTSPSKSLANVTSTNLETNTSTEQNNFSNGRNMKNVTENRDMLKNASSKGMVSSATIDADHSNLYIKKVTAPSSHSSNINIPDIKANISCSATTEITLGASDDNFTPFNFMRCLTEIWNHFSNYKNEEQIFKPNPYIRPSTPNPYVQLLNSINTTSNKHKKTIGFAQTACALIFAPATLINQALMRAADKNTLHGPSLSGYKVVAWYVDHSGELLECVKRVKNRCGTHFTDVVLAGLSASLDSYFSIHPDSCGAMPQSVTVVVPARMEAPEPIRVTQEYDTDSFSQFSDSSWGTIQLSTENERNSITLNNRFSVAMLTLPIRGKEDEVLKPRKRLCEVHHHSKQLRNSPDYLVNYWLLRVVATLLPAPFLSAVVQSSQSTLVVSNMMGPDKRLSMAGGQLRDIFFWVPHRGATGIGITILSYMDRLQLGIMADRALVTCQQDAQLILNGAVSEIKNLEHATGIQ